MTDEPRNLSYDLTWALKLHRLGYDEAAIVRSLSRRHAKHGYHSRVFAELMRERGSEPARRYALRTARKAARIAKEQPGVGSPFEARQRLSEIWGQVDAEPWPLELAGARRALEAAFSVAIERGWVAHFHLDIRTHAMRAGQSFAAIRRHRAQLVELGWLRQEAPAARGWRTTTFSFHCPTHVKTFQRTSHVQAAAVLAHDAFRDPAFGDSGWLRFQYFAQQPCKKVQDETIEYLDMIAARHGTTGTGERERSTFERERAEQAQRRADITCAAADA